jgi:hypothetical protein
LADIEREQLALDSEGTVVTNDRGTQIVNPRVSVLEQFARREMALMRTLRMGGRVLGHVESKAGARIVERKARQVKQELEEDGLLA